MKADKTDLLNVVTASMRDIKEEATELDKTETTVGMNLSIGRGKLTGEWRTLRMIGLDLQQELKKELHGLDKRLDN